MVSGLTRASPYGQSGKISAIIKKIKKLLSLSPVKTYNNQKVKMLDLSNKILLNNSIILDKV